jgi:hypothetical protein
MFFSDLHVQLLSRGILEPGEQLTGQTATSYVPMWAFGFIRRQYIVLATDRRIILVEHRFNMFRASFQLHAVESIPWATVQEARVTGFLKPKLRIRGQSERGPVNIKHRVPDTFFGLLAPMKNNMKGARAIASAFQGIRGPHALAAAPQHAYAQLPPSYAPAPQALPPINAPGYGSVPPPAPQAAAYPNPYASQATPIPPPPGYYPR